MEMRGYLGGTLGDHGGRGKNLSPRFRTPEVTGFFAHLSEIRLLCSYSQISPLPFHCLIPVPTKPLPGLGILLVDLALLLLVSLVDLVASSPPSSGSAAL